MKLTLHFIQINSDFSQGYADDVHQGEESEDNIRNLWEDEMDVQGSVRDFKIIHNRPFELAGFRGDEEFHHEIPDVSMVECFTDDGTRMQFAVSKKLIRKTELRKDPEHTHIYFYLKDTLAIENPMSGVYIARTDFPKELRSNKNEPDEN